ncbi:MAG: hypothetical protein AAF092_12590, partial [Pseudomonadota bacterium]
MAEGERLREALLELQMMRDREARTLADTQTLLDCLEAYTTAPNAGAALASIFVSLQQKLGATLTLLVTASDADQEPQGATITASDDPALLGQRIAPPFDPFGRARNISNLALLGAWGGGVEVDGFQSLIVMPASPNLALLTFRPPPTAFRRDDLRLVDRLTGLASQALRASDLAKENTLLAAT